VLQIKREREREREREAVPEEERGEAVDSTHP